MAVPDRDDLLVAAANFGGQKQPAWYHNARARPVVTITEDSRTRQFLAVELYGEDRDEAFDRALALNPGWLRFRSRAGQRGIPVFRIVLLRPDR